MRDWVLNEKTLVPMGLVLVIVAAGIHFTSVRALAAQNKEAIAEIKGNEALIRQRLFDRINNLDRRLAKIEGKLDRLLKDKQ